MEKKVTVSLTESEIDMIVKGLDVIVSDFSYASNTRDEEYALSERLKKLPSDNGPLLLTPQEMAQKIKRFLDSKGWKLGYSLILAAICNGAMLGWRSVTIVKGDNPLKGVE